MSIFQTLNINSNIELSHSLLIAQAKYNIVQKSEVKRNVGHQKTLNARARSMMLNQQQKSNQHMPPLTTQVAVEDIFTINQTPQHKHFDQQFYKKIPQNSLKITSLNFKNKPSKQNSPNKISLKNEIKQNSYTLQKVQQPINNVQKYLQAFINSLTLIEKTLQGHNVFFNKTKYVHSDRFKQILKSLLIKFNFQGNKSVQNSFNNQFHLVWKITDTIVYLTTEIIYDTAIKLTKKYQHAFRKSSQFQSFFEFLLTSDKFQLYQSQQFVFVNSQNPNMQRKQSSQGSSTKMQAFSYQEGCQAIMNIFNLSQQSQEMLQKMVQNAFLSYFVNEDLGEHKTNNPRAASYFEEQSLFNNYEFHTQASNLASFVPSYQERNHFLLDKFTQNQNIFDDEQKLSLLLKLSRDPYVPRSSAKYISQISAIVQDIFGIKTIKKQQIQQKLDDKKLRVQRQKQNQQAQDQLKEWQKMFGQLLLRI